MTGNKKITALLLAFVLFMQGLYGSFPFGAGGGGLIRAHASEIDVIETEGPEITEIVIPETEIPETEIPEIEIPEIEIPEIVIPETEIPETEIPEIEIPEIEIPEIVIPEIETPEITELEPEPPVPPQAPVSLEESNLRVSLSAAGTGVAGEEIIVYISTEFSEPTAALGGMSDYAVITVPVPNDKVIITDFDGAAVLSGEDDGTEYRVINIYINNRLMEYKLFGKDGTSDRYIEYRAYEGAAVVPLKFMFPNGVTYSESLTLTPQSDYTGGTNGIKDMRGVDIIVQSSFDWSSVRMVYGLDEGTAAIIPGEDGTGALERDITYNINADSYNSDSGSVYTGEYTAVNRITLPEGVYALGEEGEQTGGWNDAFGNLIISAPQDAVITPDVTDGARVTGFEIRLTKYNELYQPDTDDLTDMRALGETEDLDLQITLHAKSLTVDMARFGAAYFGEAGGRITAETRFTALPIVEGPWSHESGSMIFTEIPKLSSNIAGRFDLDGTTSADNPVRKGETIDYVIEAENTAWGSEEITVKAVIPAGTSLYSADEGYTAEFAGGEVRSVSWKVTVPGMGKERFKLSVTVNDEEAVRDGFNIVLNAFAGTVPLSITHRTPLSNLSVTLKALGKEEGGEVKTGDGITYTVTVENTEDGDASAEVTALIPAGTSLTGNPDNGLLNLNPGEIRWVLPVGAHKTETVSYTVSVDADAANGFEISNEARIGETLSNTLTLRTPDANVKISKTASADNDLKDGEGVKRVRPEDTVTYTLRLDNTGDGNALVKVTDALPKGVSLIPGGFEFAVNGMPETRTFDGTASPLTWDGIFVPAKGFVEISYKVRVTVRVDGEILSGRAVLNIRGTESYSNPVELKVTVPVLSFDLSSDPAPGSVVRQGDTVTYTVTVKNDGSDGGTARITSEIPEPERTQASDFAVNGRRLGLSDPDLSVDLEKGIIKYNAAAGPGERVEFSFRVNLRAMTDIYRIEQVTYIEDTDSKAVYHLLPLPVLGQEKLSVVQYKDDDGKLTERLNNVFKVEENSDMTVFDPSAGESGQEVPFDGETISYVFKGDSITYTVNALNFGEGSGSVVISDKVPYGTTFDGDVSQGGVYDAETREITWEGVVAPAVLTEEGGGALKPGIMSVSFSVRVDGDLRDGFNIASQASVNTEATNRIDYYLPMSDVIIEKSALINGETDGDAEIQNVRLGEKITYTLTLTNRGLADALVKVRDQLPPGVKFLGVKEGSLAPSLKQDVSTALTWDEIPVAGLAGVSNSGVPAAELVFDVEVYGAEAFQELVNSLMGRDPQDSGDGESGIIAVKPGNEKIEDPDAVLKHPGGTDINDTEEIFNYAVLTDLTGGKNDRFSNTVRHRVVRPIFSFTLSADPEDMKNIEEASLLGSGLEEGDTIRYFIDVANSGHDRGTAVLFSEIPELTELCPQSAYTVSLDGDGNETGERTPVPLEAYFGADGKGAGFADKNGSWVYGIVYGMEVPAMTVMRFAFEARAGKLYDGFRIEETAWVNKLRSRTVYHYSPIPKVTAAKSASIPYADERAVYPDDMPNGERRFQTLWPNGGLVPFPWEYESGFSAPGLPSGLSNGVPHLMTGAGRFDPKGPTAVKAGDRFTYYITLWSESSRSSVDVVDVLPAYLTPVAGSARVEEISTSQGAFKVEAESIGISQGSAVYQGVTLPEYTVRWNGVRLPKTTAYINAPVVLAVDVVVQIPKYNETVVSNRAEVTGVFRQPDGSEITVSCVTNGVENVIIRSSAPPEPPGPDPIPPIPPIPDPPEPPDPDDREHIPTDPTDPEPVAAFTKTGFGENRNDPYAQLGERISYTLRWENISKDTPDNFEITDTLHVNLDAESVTDIGAEILNLKMLEIPDATDDWKNDIHLFIDTLEWNYDKNERTITWKGGLKPGEYAELTFSANVKSNKDDLIGDRIINYGVLNGMTASNAVEHIIISDKSVKVEKRNNNPQQIVPGGVIEYTINASNDRPISTKKVLVKDKLSEYTTFLADSDVITGGVNTYRYGGSDSAGMPFTPGNPRYDSETHFDSAGYLTWVFDLAPSGEGNESERERAVTITYKVTINDRVPEGAQIVNRATIFTDINEPGEPFSDDPDPIPGKTTTGSALLIVPKVVEYEKYSSVPWDEENDETKRLNRNPENASLISNGESIRYFIDLTVPETAKYSSYVNVTDYLPYITEYGYAGGRVPDGAGRIAGRAVFDTGEKPSIKWSDGNDYKLTDDQDGYDMGEDVITWNLVEIPPGVTATLSFSVRVLADERELAQLGRDSRFLIENKAYVNGSETNSVFHEMGRAAIVGEKYAGVIENGEIRWVQSTDWINGIQVPKQDERIYAGHGQIIPYKIALGNAGYAGASVTVRDQINGLMRVVEATLEDGDEAKIIGAAALKNGSVIEDERGMKGRLNTGADNVTWLEWDDIKVEAGTAEIHGVFYDKDGSPDPRTWLHVINDPDAAATSVSGLRFTITDPTEIVFYVQIIGDPDQGQQIPNHALFSYPYLEENEAAGMGRTNQVDLYAQRSLLAARQKSDPEGMPDGASVSDGLKQGRLRHGDETVYTVEIANAGGADTFAEIVFPMPEGMEFAGMVSPSDASLNPWADAPEQTKRTVTRNGADGKPKDEEIDVLVWQSVPVHAPAGGKGLLNKASGEVVTGQLKDENGEDVTYIGIGSVSDTHAAAGIMKWEDAGRASVTFKLRVKDDMPGGSRVDSAPLITEKPALDFEVPLLNVQPVKTYPAVITHFVPIADITGAKTAEFYTGGRRILTGRRVVNDNGKAKTENFLKINGEDADLSELDDIFADRGTEITYTLTAYNFGLSKGLVSVWDQVPMHTEFLSGDGARFENGALLWDEVSVPEYDEDAGIPGVVSRSFTVRIEDGIANGAAIENMAVIAGSNTNKLIFNTRPPEIEAEKSVAVYGKNGELGEFIKSDGVFDRFGFEGIPVTAGTEVVYRIVLKNKGEGTGVVRIEDRISQMLHGVTDISDGGVLLGNTVIWDDINLAGTRRGDTPNERTLTFKAVVGYDERSGVPQPAQSTLIHNTAVYNNAKPEDAAEPDPELGFGGEIGLGLAKTNAVTLSVQRSVISAEQTSGPEPGSEVLPGEEITYSVILKNTGGAPAELEVKNKLPNETALKTGSIKHSEDFSNNISWGITDGAIIWNLTLDPGDEVTLGFTVTVNESAPNGTLIQNAPEVDNKPVLPAVITHNVPLADITGEKTVRTEHTTEADGKSYAGVTSGGIITYTITLRNRAKVNGNLLVSDQIPIGTELIKNTISHGGEFLDEYRMTDEKGASQVLKNVIVWKNMSVPKNSGGEDGIVNLSFNVTARALPDGQKIKNTAQYGSKFTEEAVVVMMASEFKGLLRAEVNAVPAVNAVTGVRAGDEVTYFIDITNTGRQAGSVNVTNQVPNGTEYADGSAKPNLKSNALNVLEWALSDIQPGGKVTVSFSVTVGKLANGTVIKNDTAYIEGGESLNVFNLITLAPALTAALTAEPPGGQVKAGDLIDFTVRLKNDGDAEGTADVTANIPDGMKLANNGSGKEFTLGGVTVPAKGSKDITYRLEVTGVNHGGGSIYEGYAMTSAARVYDEYTEREFSTNTVIHSFAPVMIYPGIVLGVLGNTRTVNGVLTLTPSVNGAVDGAERTDGIKLGVTLDNTKNSVNTTPAPMEDYKVLAELPALHTLDRRTGTAINPEPVFIRIVNGGETLREPIPAEDYKVTNNPLGSPQTVTFELNGGKYKLEEGETARIEFYTRAEMNGNADPLYFKAILIPKPNEPSQRFNPGKVTRGTVTDAYGSPALEAYANVFIVGIYTTRAHIEAADGALSARGDAQPNFIQSAPGNGITYRLVLENTSPVSYNDVTLIGRMPYAGDAAVINSSIPRGSGFGIDFTGITSVSIIGADGIIRPVTPESVGFMLNKASFSTNNWNGTGWSASPAWDAGDEGQSYRIALGKGFALEPLETLTVEISARVPEGALLGETAWNSFAYRYIPETMPGMTLRSEVSVAGVNLAGFNVTKAVDGYLAEDAEFNIVVQGDFSDSSKEKIFNFTADEIKDGAVKPVPGLVNGKRYRITEPEPGDYEAHIDTREILFGTDNVTLVTVTNKFTGSNLVWHRVNDSELGKINYAGGNWTHRQYPYKDADGEHGNLYWNDQSYANTAGAYAEFTFTGTAVRWIGAYSTNLGIAEVWIDGVNVTGEKGVNQYKSEKEFMQVLFESRELEFGEHTVRVVVTERHDPDSRDDDGGAPNFVTVDAFEFLGEPTTPPATVTVNDKELRITYDGNWYHGVDSGNAAFVNGDQSHSNQTGDFAEFTFTGTSIAWIGPRQLNGGIAAVSIDGKPAADVDLYFHDLESGEIQIAREVLFSKNGLNDGVHTIKIEVTGRTNAPANDADHVFVIIDAFEFVSP